MPRRYGHNGRFRAAQRLLTCTALLLLLTACQTELNRGLSESEANAEVAILLRAGIPASREADAKGGTMTVYVEKSRFAEAVEQLNQHGYPRPRFASIGSVFAGGGLVSSPMDERARMIYALSQELSHTISDIDGVLTARVQIVLPDNDPLRGDTTPSSASVFIRYDPSAPINTMVPQIKMLVANGVSGLTYDKVSVVTVPAALPAERNATAETELVSVAGIWIYRGSAWMLQMILGISITVILVLGAAVGWLTWRHSPPIMRQRSGSPVIR